MRLNPWSFEDCGACFAFACTPRTVYDSGQIWVMRGGNADSQDQKEMQTLGVLLVRPWWLGRCPWLPYIQSISASVHKDSAAQTKGVSTHQLIIKRFSGSHRLWPEVLCWPNFRCHQNWWRSSRIHLGWEVENLPNPKVLLGWVGWTRAYGPEIMDQSLWARVYARVYEPEFMARLYVRYMRKTA